MVVHLCRTRTLLFFSRKPSHVDRRFVGRLLYVIFYRGVQDVLSPLVGRPSPTQATDLIRVGVASRASSLWRHGAGQLDSCNSVISLSYVRFHGQWALRSARRRGAVCFLSTFDALSHHRCVSSRPPSVSFVSTDAADSVSAHWRHRVSINNKTQNWFKLAYNDDS